MYSVIIFLVVVLPFTNEKYISNGDFSIANRTINFVFSLFLFSIFFEEFRTMQWSFYESKSLFNQEELLRCPLNILYCYLIKVVYMLTCFYIAASSLGLGRGNEKTRKRFLKHIKYIWIPIALYFSLRSSFDLELQLGANLLIMIFVMSVIVGIMMMIIYFFYNSAYIKKLFS